MSEIFTNLDNEFLKIYQKGWNQSVNDISRNVIFIFEIITCKNKINSNKGGII